MSKNGLWAKRKKNHKLHFAVRGYVDSSFPKTKVYSVGFMIE